MKNLFKVAGIFLLTAFTIVSFYSCSRSDDPADNDFLPEHIKEMYLIEITLTLPLLTMLTEAYL